MGKSTISMAIFNSYVSLPEGNSKFHDGFCWWYIELVVMALWAIYNWGHHLVGDFFSALAGKN